jgi:serine/threonine protein kinase
MSQELQNIGRYQILSILGQGAMGRVFLAQDPLLKRKVAIKIVQEKAQEASSQAMERFQREAEISARLNHPNIITVYDVGVDDQAGPFLAMEYVEGASLARFMREKRPDHENILKLLIQGAQALHAAGAAGIVHRDVKPENMLVSQDGRLKLMDFGIANQADQTRLTALGTVVGTPSYTAPEVLMGGEPSAATDRYAFAVTAFECFTGQVPFVGDTVGATLLKIVHEPPSIPRDMPHELGEVFEIALAKDPATRYPDLFTLIDALIEAASVPAPVKVKLQAALEGEGTLSGVGSGPILPPLGGGTNPGVPPPPASQSSSDQATMALRATPLPSAMTKHGEDPLAFLGELEAKQGEPPRVVPPQAPGASSSRDDLKTTGPLPLPLPIPESRSSTANLPPSAPPSKRTGLWLAAAVVVLVGGGAAVALPMLKPKPRQLSVKTDPPGAKVRVDGIEVAGQTPMVKTIPPNTTKVEVILAGFEPQGGALPTEGPVDLNYTLVPLPARLNLKSDPPGARVTINGEFIGETPIQNQLIPEKVLKSKDAKTKPMIRVEKEGYGVFVQDYERGRDLEITLQPEKPATKKR